MPNVDMQNEALRYAEGGLAVLPCKPGGKDPAVSGAYKSATRDPQTIKRWFASDPTPNLGVHPGASRHVVLDIDVKNDKDGEGDLFMAECEHGPLPETWTVRTPSGGWHLWFAVPEGYALPGNASLSKSIDVRSAKGYVLLPPSTIDGEPYETTSGGTPIAELPRGWCERLVGPAEPAGPAEPDVIDMLDALDARPAEPAVLDSDDAVERAAKFLSTTRQVSIMGEGGDATAYNVACELRDLGVSETTALELMDDYWNDRCDPPWDVYEPTTDPEGKCLAQKVHNAYAYAGGQPGGKAPTPAEQAFAAFAVPPDKTAPTPANDNDGDGGFEERKTRPPRLMSTADVDGLEPPEWLLDDCLPQASLVALYGPPGSYKSFLALDWAYHIAHGRPWAGHECDAPGRVLYVAGEGTSGIQKRLRAWREHHGEVIGSELGELTVTDTMPQIGDTDAWSEWRADIEAAGPWDLIIFDTLAYLTFGLEENSNSDMMLALKRLSDFREATGATMMVVHHSGKAGDTMRGATSILGACDTVFRMDKDTQVQGQGRLYMTKQKDAEAWQGHLGIQAAEYTVAHDRKGRPKSSLALTKGRHNELPSDGELDQAHQTAEEAFADVSDDKVPLEEQPDKLAGVIAEILGVRRNSMARKDLAAQVAQHLGREASEAGYIDSILKASYKHPAINRFVPPKKARTGEVPEWFRWVDSS